MENQSYYSEILLVDKPKGWSSYDCIRKIKNAYPKKTKIGHAGTLDPAASGLLIIGIGSATKKLSEFLKLPKTYIAEILLGIKTETGDLDGAVIEEKTVLESGISEAIISETLRALEGELELAVPKYSAVKQNGTALYKLARSGKEVKPPVKKMEVKRAELLRHWHVENTYHVEVKFHVSSGTYIRSLAEEFGRLLGVPATLANLRRTRIGDFQIEDAVKINTD